MAKVYKVSFSSWLTCGPQKTSVPTLNVVKMRTWYQEVHEFFVSESFIGHVEMTICQLEPLRCAWLNSAYQGGSPGKHTFPKITRKNSEPQYDGKKKGLNPPAMRSATTKQKKDQFGFHNFLFVIKLPLPLVLPAVGFNSMKIIYCIHMALQVFSGFETKKGTWQCSPRPMLQLPGDRWIHELRALTMEVSPQNKQSV